MHSAESRSFVCPCRAHDSHGFPSWVAESLADANDDAGFVAPLDVDEAGFASPLDAVWVGFVDGANFAASLGTLGVEFVQVVDFETLLAADGVGFVALLGVNDRRPCFPNVGTQKATATISG